MAAAIVAQEVAARPSDVFDAFTSAEALARWWWPHIRDTTYAIEPRVGGRYEIRSGEAGIGVRGAIVALDRPQLIEVTWEWLDDHAPQAADEVRIELVPDGAGTVVRVTHTCPEESVEDQRQGWTDVLGRLAATLGGRL
jgi:uncharacterized protein YndB with AHSA1/START domain